MTGQQQEKWQQVADLIQRLGLVSSGQDEPRQPPSAGGHLQPGLGGPYNGHPAEVAATTTIIDTNTRQPHTVTDKATISSNNRHPRDTCPRNTCGAAPVPRPTGVIPSPTGRVRTEAQQARNRRKFQQLKEKRKARESEANQQRRLAKQPAPTSDPEAAGTSPANPTPMEVDKPASKDGKSEEPGQPTS
ncbi:uncharacterized protein LOC132943267 [Metopolophium dirhodum]|uniref:uncharacterized protein LOC132943267 n=1 Tax=Metopolophium dirhodum TaxID=44670 RepID=UPI00298F4818|nr:uncharacterized protein LOC132943267 [Metopolophium dirhodum]